MLKRGRTVTMSARPKHAPRQRKVGNKGWGEEQRKIVREEKTKTGAWKNKRKPVTGLINADSQILVSIKQ
jgi:hypothetical protein